MGLKNKEYINYIESLINIFTVEQGQIKILLFRKKVDPYKGYWALPSDIVRNDVTIEDTVSDVVYDIVGLKSLYIEQCHTFSHCDRGNDEYVTAVSYIGLIDSKSAEIKREERSDYESAWFDIDTLPKLAYDHEVVINNAIELLKKKIVNVSVLKTLFPSDFSLPELQMVYEKLLGKTLDRRNFRKKFVGLGLVEPTGDKNEGGNGRPAKLYSFTENIEDKNLF